MAYPAMRRIIIEAGRAFDSVPIGMVLNAVETLYRIATLRAVRRRLADDPHLLVALSWTLGNIPGSFSSCLSLFEAALAENAKPFKASLPRGLRLCALRTISGLMGFFAERDGEDSMHELDGMLSNILFMGASSEDRAIIGEEDKDKEMNKMARAFSAQTKRAYRGNSDFPDCCDRCGKQEGSESTTLNRCGRCKVGRYCSKECQTADWPSHKARCGDPAACESEYDASLLFAPSMTRIIQQQGRPQRGGGRSAKKNGKRK